MEKGEKQKTTEDQKKPMYGYLPSPGRHDFAHAQYRSNTSRKERQIAISPLVIFCPAMSARGAHFAMFLPLHEEAAD
jgi:hypothetical protein